MRVPTFVSAAVSVVLAGAGHAHAGESAFDSAMGPVVKHYLTIQDALARDTTDGVKQAARGMLAAAEKLDPSQAIGKHAGHYAGVPTKIKAGAKGVAVAGNLKEAREAFKVLSKPLAMWGSMAKPAGIDVVYCSMARGSWLQKAGPIRNPYHGSSMLACGEVVGGINFKGK